MKCNLIITELNLTTMGSQYKTSLLFKWLKVVWFSYGNPVKFKCNGTGRQKCYQIIRTSSPIPRKHSLPHYISVLLVNFCYFMQSDVTARRLGLTLDPLKSNFILINVSVIHIFVIQIPTVVKCNFKIAESWGRQRSSVRNVLSWRSEGL